MPVTWTRSVSRHRYRYTMDATHPSTIHTYIPTITITHPDPVVNFHFPYQFPILILSITLPIYTSAALPFDISLLSVCLSLSPASVFLITLHPAHYSTTLLYTRDQTNYILNTLLLTLIPLLFLFCFYRYRFVFFVVCMSVLSHLAFYFVVCLWHCSCLVCVLSNLSGGNRQSYCRAGIQSWLSMHLSIYLSTLVLPM